MRSSITGPLLALDTSGRACGVCVWHDGAVLARADRAMEHGHAEALAPMAGQVLADAGLSVQDLAAIAVTVGPGSFTGLRVGLAFSRGLALAAGCPVLGFASTAVLAVMAAPTEPRDAPIAVIVDARRAEVFLHLFDSGALSMGDPVSLPPDRALAMVPNGPVRLFGDGVGLLPMPLPPGALIAPDAARPPDPAALAEFAATHPGQAGPPRPLYVRAPDATLPPPNTRARP
ncbi:tRNA (adenosine(37)-N6)-threonylcarbamoyltransferase complex dimerization subunit type 1 TsaB [Rhodospira trueperi]|uniref:tRNA threonylcarbamoyladenosine biosynthesis protein TsaB n=1 Tax=Rhodospira trueperi TaxID=69960 RepID=A0A1G7ECI4_9PROT|nr:tRNA (adenosine(37)-N6)-threonylcarbamoyltransferase complex dimerization subunit type 1 TsaB [Rhodospira trueperi]SDE61166.1 tRNA threonylcarbamoyladenosine biosynthesis protein TsaB [Rhodospira trueperi]